MSSLPQVVWLRPWSISDMLTSAGRCSPAASVALRWEL